MLYPSRQLKHTKAVLAGVLLTLCCAFPAYAQEHPYQRVPTVDEEGRYVIAHESGHGSGAWTVERGWDREAEMEFADFVESFGEARERNGFTFSQGIRTERWNPLWTEEDRDFDVKVDCATFPYLVRAYFAYKTKRPFAWQSNKGRRYSSTNKPRYFSDWTQFEDLASFFSTLDSSISSAHFRVAADIEGTDTYPVDVTMESVQPGTVYYDPNGHVMIAYRVDNYSGDVYFLDSHPDGTMTIRKFGKQYGIGSAKYGGGFRNWRHDDVEVTDAETGAFTITRKLNRESDFYDAQAQYRWDFMEDGFELNYWEWIRARVSRNGIYAYPVEDFNLLLDTVCDEIQSRVNSVDIAIRDGLSTRKHPNKLPYNIYGAAGEWEEYSTPGRDVRIRSAIKEAFAYVIKTMELAQAGSSRLKYDLEPWDLYKEYQRIWDEHDGNKLCQFRYTNSQGAVVQLSLNDVMGRLFDLSFDPYHCPEYRWGAHPRSRYEAARKEAATCPEDARKLFWFYEENRLRNRTSRLLGRGTGTHVGPLESPDLDIPGLLKCYADNLPEWDKCHTRARLKSADLYKKE